MCGNEQGKLINTIEIIIINYTLIIIYNYSFYILVWTYEFN